MRGRKPVPTHLKLLRGNPGKRPIPITEPIPDTNLGDPPAHLDDEQAATWRAELAHAPLGMLKATDAALFETFISALCVYRRTYKHFSDAKHAVLSLGDKQRPVISPLIRLLKMQSNLIKQTAAELGLSPVSRARCVGQTKTISSEAKDFLQFSKPPLQVIEGGKKA
jgi:P27 family predicted phage terminase small subunit